MQVRQLATSGVWVATRGTDSTVAYVVTVAGCECRAASEGDPVCCHRVMQRNRLGMVDRPEPTPPAMPAAVLPISRPVCPDCRGDGYLRRQSATFAGITFRATCRGRGGNGEGRRAA
ncbi:MAG: hypothetical protein ACR2OO_14280 [Thermomicrobiales bacterium]